MRIDKADNILVIRYGAMGDVLVATPLLPNLRAAFPESRISFLVQKRFAGALRKNPYLNEVIEFDRDGMGQVWGIGRIKKELRFLASIRQREFDAVFDLQGNLRTAILALMSGARERVGFTYRIRKYFYNRKVPARNPQYVVDFNLDTLRAVGIPVKAGGITIPVDESDKAFASRWLTERGLKEGDLLIGLFPGGGWQSKKWCEDSFSKLGEMLSSGLKAKVLLIGGPQEAESVKRIVSSMRGKAHEVLGLSLSELAGLITKLDLFVSNDSGPRYIAVGAGIPSIGLFGPTSFANANPPCAIHSAVTYGGDCLACNKTACEDNKCMKGISPERVFEECRKLLKQSGRVK
jgi:ADP-heptose:LPS heptosyltransferase